jgi:hypothetical protein
MKKVLFLQQGDVLIKRVNSLPSKAIAKKPTPKGYVLAEGEHTGHAHRIANIETDICELYEKDGVLYIKANNPCNLTHEEHKQITIPEGIWEIGIVKEYDHFLEEARNVED